MAVIAFYDCSERDEQQLRQLLSVTDHYPIFIREHLTHETVATDAEIVSLFVASNFSSDLFDRFPRLRMIACRSTGFNNIDLNAAAQRNIVVTNVPTYGEHTVAEYAFAMLLSHTRKIRAAFHQAREGVDDAEQLTGTDLFDRTIGVVGTGRIGMNVVKIALGFGMRVVAYDPFPKNDQAGSMGFTYVELDELLRLSDVISLHAPLTNDNKHMMNTDTFEKMKRNAILVNTARGELVDTSALLVALEQKKLAGAVLDVVEGEKYLSASEEMRLLRANQTDTNSYEQELMVTLLEKLPNVILTHHNAYNTEEAIFRINQTTVQNVIDFWNNKFPNKVEPSAVQSGKLVIMRHAESEWNAKGMWTGTTDVHLSDKGKHEAGLLGQKITDIKFDAVYCSQQSRTHETAEIALRVAGQTPEVIVDGGLNERDYGIYTGKNKWEVQKEIGEEAWQAIRRGWDVPVPGGETLKEVYDRAVSFYISNIVPRLVKGENILIVAHGNSIRSLMKYIESISDEKISDTEMLFETILVYEVDENGRMFREDKRTIDSMPPPA